MSYVHINIRSLLRKYDLFEYGFLDGEFDLIGVTESWLTACMPNNVVTCKGYNLIRKDRNTLQNTNGSGRVKRGGGLCLYLKDNFEYEELFPLNRECAFEWLCVKLSRGNLKQQTLTLIYRPPSFCANKAIEDHRQCLDYLTEHYRNYEHIILGDININYMNSRCQLTKALKSLEQFYGIKQLIKLPTRMGTINNSIIHLCFTNMNNVSSTGVIEYRLSDHYPIFVIKKKNRPIKKERSFTGRCYKNYNINLLREKLENINWDQIRYEHNPNNQWNFMQESFIKVADDMCSSLC